MENNTLWIILGSIGFIILYVIGLFNALVRLNNHVKEAWSDIEVQMKRRYDLIPNLVETVKGYAKHEKETLDNVIKARTLAMNAQSMDEHAKAENTLQKTLKSIFALSESYPDLKANQNFLELQKELTDTEDKIQASRRFYNGNVMSFNTKIEQFPANFISQMFNFKKHEYFDLGDETDAKKPVKVSF